MEGKKYKYQTVKSIKEESKTGRKHKSKKIKFLSEVNSEEDGAPEDKKSVSLIVENLVNTPSKS